MDPDPDPDLLYPNYMSESGSRRPINYESASGSGSGSTTMIETNNYKLFFIRNTALHSRTAEAELYIIFGANKGMLVMYSYVLNENKSRATQ